MTRKDYVMIAEVLKKFVGDMGDVIDRDQICLDLADAFALDNPRFDRDRFLVACSVYTGCSVCGAKMRYATGQGEWCAEHLPDWAKKIQHQISATN
jgi:hypothetical protein